MQNTIRVGWDCRPGDVIFHPDRGNLRIDSTFPGKVLTVKDEHQEYFSYQELWDLGAIYVARVHVQKPNGDWSP